MEIKEYRKVENLEEAWQLNQKKSNHIIGGMLWMKMGRRRIQTAIDLSGLGLDQIEETESEFRIGCMATLRDLEEHEGLDAYTKGAMKEALCHIVGVQFRNLATVGGSIYGRFGFSDVLTMFLVMDTSVEVYRGGSDGKGSMLIPLEEYAKQSYDNDILVRLVVKKTGADFVYQSVRNTQTDFPVLACAGAKYAGGSDAAKSSSELDGDCAGNVYRFALGARPARAVLLRDDAGILQETAGETVEKAEKFAAWAKGQIPTGTNLRGSGEYRSHLVEVLVKRAVMRLNDNEK